MTEEAQNEQTITIDDKVYKVADLNDEQRYLVLQIQDLQNKANDLSFKLDQVTVAKKSFFDTLNQKLNEDKNDG